MKKPFFTLLLSIPLLATAQPDSKNCIGTLVPFETVWRGQIKAQITLAKNYFFDSANHFGTLEQRTAKLDSVVKKVFKDFTTDRKEEMSVLKCHYIGSDYNKKGGHSWKSITTDEGYAFDTASLKLYGEKPTFLENNTKFSWFTGGSSKVIIDAVISNIDDKILKEITLVRKDLSDMGIPTKYP